MGFKRSFKKAKQIGKNLTSKPIDTVLGAAESFYTWGAADAAGGGISGVGRGKGSLTRQTFKGGGLAKIFKGGKKPGQQEIPLPPELQDVTSKARLLQSGELEKLKALGKATNIDTLLDAANKSELLEQQLSQAPQRAAIRQRELEATSGIGDARRQLRERIAQTGLGTSSIGLAAERSLEKSQRSGLQEVSALRGELGKQTELGRQLVAANDPLRRRELALQTIQQQAGIGGNILGQPGALPYTAMTAGKPSFFSQTLPLIGMGVGGVIGSAAGPVGTLAGSQIGLGAGQVTSNLFNRGWGGSY